MNWKHGKLEQEAPSGGSGGGGGTRPGADGKPIEVAVAAALAVIDRVQRAIAQAGPRIEDVRAKRAEREAARLAHKHGARSPIVLRAKLAVRERVAVAATAIAAAQRARVPLVKAGADETIVHGRVVDERRAGRGDLDVQLKAGDKALATTHTDADGYFALTVPSSAASVVEDRRVLVAMPGRPSGALRVVVLRRDKVVHEDKEPMSVRTGRAMYREITTRE